MKPALVDTDILSEFLRGTETVVQNVNEYLHSYETINLSIITYYEIMNGLVYKDARKQLSKFTEFAELNRILPLTGYFGLSMPVISVYGCHFFLLTSRLHKSCTMIVIF